MTSVTMLFRYDFVRFTIVSAIGVLVDLSVALLLFNALGIPLIIAAFFGFCAGAVFNYLLHEYWTFGGGTGPSLKRGAVYVLTLGVTLGVRLSAVAILQLFVPQGPGYAFFVLVPAVALSFAANYLFSKFAVFRPAAVLPATSTSAHFETPEGEVMWSVPEHRVELIAVDGQARGHRHALVIPVLNEGERIRAQLCRIAAANLPVDVIVADGGSTDGSLDREFLSEAGVHALLVKEGRGRLSAQLRMAYAWCLQRGYDGIVTVDGNGKDSVEAVADFVAKLDGGYDYVQGSRYRPGGIAENTPLERTIGNRLIHAPMMSLAGGHWFTDTTNGFRAYSRRYLFDPRVQPFRDVFMNYELLFYLTVRAGQTDHRVCEIPVRRSYPKDAATPTKIAGLQSKLALFSQAFDAAAGKFTPRQSAGSTGRDGRGDGAEAHGLADGAPRLLTGAATLMAGITLVAFIVLFLRAVDRPLWADELTAMTNYPLSSIKAFFLPLPFYGQASPPLFNVVTSLVAPVPAPLGRSIIGLAVFGGMAWVAWAQLRRWWAPVIAALFAIAAPNVLYYATEFKYYGLEMPGAALGMLWIARKGPAEPFNVRDLLLLGLVSLTGISTMVIVAGLAAAFVILRLADRGKFSIRELALLASLGIFLAAYYLLIKHMTTIQIAAYPDSYDVSGPEAARRLVRAIIHLLGMPAILIVILSCLVAIGVATREAFRFFFASGVVILAFLVLSFVGLYPGMQPRHVAWAAGIGLFATVLGAQLLLPTRLRYSRLRAAGAACIATAVVLLALRPAAAVFQLPDYFVHTDNRAVVQWLEKEPPLDVALWIAGQPLVEYYGRRVPSMGRHHYFGAVNVESTKPLPHLSQPDSVGQSPAAIDRIVEGLRDKAGYWSSSVVYRTRENYDAPARSLVREAPRGRPFAIVASHLDYDDASSRRGVLRREALLAALDSRGCSHKVALKAKNAFVLIARCPDDG